MDSKASKTRPAETVPLTSEARSWNLYTMDGQYAGRIDYTGAIRPWWAYDAETKHLGNYVSRATARRAVGRAWSRRT